MLTCKSLYRNWSTGSSDCPFSKSGRQEGSIPRPSSRKRELNSKSSEPLTGAFFCKEWRTIGYQSRISISTICRLSRPNSTEAWVYSKQTQELRLRWQSHTRYHTSRVIGLARKALYFQNQKQRTPLPVHIHLKGTQVRWWPRASDHHRWYPTSSHFRSKQFTLSSDCAN